MEANLKKFVCKYCNKKFQCGKSLGGHIRIHFQGSSTTSRTDFDDDDDGSNGGKFNYGLREKPKKSSRFVLNNSDFVRVCRECGKGFQSLKALCGHMACHSKNSSSCFDDDDDVELDSESDNESYKKRRSKRIRFKKMGTQSESFSVGYDSSCFDSDVEQEQEEVAMSLMMLSRDSGFKGWFSSVSSDNNSVVLEDSRKIRSVNFADNGDHREPVVSIEKERSANSDSEYFNGEPEQVEYESVYLGFAGDSAVKKRKMVIGSDDDDDDEFDAELGKRLSRFRRVKSNRGKDMADDYGSDHDNNGSLKRSSRKGSKFTDENSVATGNRKIKHRSKKAEKRVVSKKGEVHECPFCSKVFKSGQALGGHKRSHFVGGASEDRTIVIKEVEQPSLIDLNLPAPTEEDSNWVQSKW